jgi:hypothetical protein
MSYGHLPSAMGESGSKRSLASSGLVPSWTARSSQLRPFSGVVDELGQEPFGLVDEAGE